MAARGQLDAARGVQRVGQAQQPRAQQRIARLVPPAVQQGERAADGLHGALLRGPRQPLARLALQAVVIALLLLDVAVGQRAQQQQLIAPVAAHRLARAGVHVREQAIGLLHAPVLADGVRVGPAVLQQQDAARQLLLQRRVDEVAHVLAHRVLRALGVVPVLLAPHELVHVVVHALGVGDRAHAVGRERVVDVLHRPRPRVAALAPLHDGKRGIAARQRELAAHVVRHIRVVTDASAVDRRQLVHHLLNGVLLPRRKAHAPQPGRLLAHLAVEGLIPARLGRKALRREHDLGIGMVSVQ